MFDNDSVGFLIVFIVLLILFYGIHVYLKERRSLYEATAGYPTNQDDDIWNISSRVNQQGQGPVLSQPANWPTHDHHIPVESFVPGQKKRAPPPPYTEVDLPSYEQATGCPAPKTDLPVVHSLRSAAGPST